MFELLEEEKRSFTVPGIPVSKGRPIFSRKGGYPSAYTPNKTKKAEEVVYTNYYSQVDKPPFDKDTPILLRITAYFPLPKPHPKYKERALDGGAILPHIKKPDLDNVVKLVSDALNKVAWYDDSSIAGLECYKKYGMKPMTLVEIIPIVQEDFLEWKKRR